MKLYADTPVPSNLRVQEPVAGTKEAFRYLLWRYVIISLAVLGIRTLARDFAPQHADFATTAGICFLCLVFWRSGISKDWRRRLNEIPRSWEFVYGWFGWSTLMTILSSGRGNSPLSRYVTWWIAGLCFAALSTSLASRSSSAADEELNSFR